MSKKFEAEDPSDLVATVSSSLPRSIVAAPMTSETTLKFHFTEVWPVTILKHWLLALLSPI